MPPITHLVALPSSYVPGDAYGLGADGSLWQLSRDRWTLLPPLPGDRIAAQIASEATASRRVLYVRATDGTLWRLEHVRPDGWRALPALPGARGAVSVSVAAGTGRATVLAVADDRTGWSYWGTTWRILPPIGV